VLNEHYYLSIYIYILLSFTVVLYRYHYSYSIFELPFPSYNIKYQINHNNHPLHNPHTMAGHGNINAPDLNPSDLASQHDSTRFNRTDTHPYSGGHSTYGSGTTGGAGFGNKSAPDPENIDTSDLRFGSHSNTDPYSGRGKHGSGSVGGAGYGNKTGSFGESHGKWI
jgi:hypothetical protein